MCRAYDSTLSSSQRAPMLARAAISSDGSTGGGCSSKPTPMAAGRIRFLPGWWSEDYQQAVGWRPPQFLPHESLHRAAHNREAGFFQCKQIRGWARWEPESLVTRYWKWYPTLFITNPLKTGGLTQGHEYQEVGISGALLEASYHILKLPLPTHIPPNSPSQKAPLFTTSESFLTLFPPYPQPELNSTCTEAFNLWARDLP